MNVQQVTSLHNRYYSGQMGGNPKQVDCKGDKIENMSQLLIHLGMGDIKDKCCNCDIEVRNTCLERQAKENLVEEDVIATEKSLADSQSIEIDSLKISQSSNKNMNVENRAILSGFFSSIFVVALAC